MATKPNKMSGHRRPTAKDYNNLLAYVEAMTTIKAGGGVRVSSNPSGHTIAAIARNSETIIRRAKTQEAAQGDAYISVKLLEDDGTTVTGDAFDAECIFSDSATAANACTPQVASGKYVIITRLQGEWYILNPTFTSVGSSCT